MKRFSIEIVTSANLGEAVRTYSYFVLKKTMAEAIGDATGTVMAELNDSETDDVMKITVEEVEHQDQSKLDHS